MSVIIYKAHGEQKKTGGLVFYCNVLSTKKKREEIWFWVICLLSICFLHPDQETSHNTSTPTPTSKGRPQGRDDNPLVPGRCMGFLDSGVPRVPQNDSETLPHSKGRSSLRDDSPFNFHMTPLEVTPEDVSVSFTTQTSLNANDTLLNET